ncbi:MAG TPA: DUF6797 domain-containing protein [Verrucomicrobiales bacterium]|nr:DUF6797 domain-containing protein [Verrucomicrobiales bacterium]
MIDTTFESSPAARAPLFSPSAGLLLTTLLFLSPGLHAEEVSTGLRVAPFQETLPPGWRVAQQDQTWEAARDLTTTLGAYADFRLHLRYHAPALKTDSAIVLGDSLKAALPATSAGWTEIDLLYSHQPGAAAIYSLWNDGRAIGQDIEIPGSRAAGRAFFQAGDSESNEKLSTSGDFTVAARFRTTDGGTLFARAPAEGEWQPDAKALFVRGGRLVYDIGWVGALTLPNKIDDDEWRTVVLVVQDSTATLQVEGGQIVYREDFQRSDADGHVFKIGSAASNFGGDYHGDIEWVRFYQRALDPEAAGLLVSGREDEGNTPDFQWRPEPRPSLHPGWASAEGRPVPVALEAPAGFLVSELWFQPLDECDHAALIASCDQASFERGQAIYQTLCLTCHGVPGREGTLPTALKFWEAPFRNGHDPYRMFRTLADGFELMVPQPQYSPRQKYDVIHYIREAFLKDANPSQYAAVTPAYLKGLPRGRPGIEAAAPGQDLDATPPYERMDFGPFLMWTYEVAPDNIAYKGIAVRLDPGPGGVSKGRAWIIYDHDTLRVAAASSGESFVDWKGIAFDGSHGTHTSITGNRAWVNPVGPGWAHPQTGSWEDPRLLGRDGKPYGPLPGSWARYRGLHTFADRVTLRYTVGETEILETPGFIDYGAVPIFTRTLEVGPSRRDLALRAAPEEEGLQVALHGPDGVALSLEEGFHVARISAKATPLRFVVSTSRLDEASLEALTADFTGAPGPQDWLEGATRRWDQEVTTEGVYGESTGPFAVDTIVTPDGEANPWNSWMRLGGFDFFPDGDRAAVCTWMGDVWVVSGLAGRLATLRWTRIASGLFQPLGLKILNGVVHVACRDQIVRLHDHNGNGETDFYECFNNDHQVTEHFHEFAMGLQADAAGNLYYAKSARHALDALVPHHGTLLRVSADGSRTDILATGFRAANGVCLNPDGTYIVTDQEGHWNPKNRINWVRDGGFYGNMFGYHHVTDSSDQAMEQPLCWITNTFDRSPAELVWVEGDAWGPLNGSLLNLSYGYGKVYVVPHETIGGVAQGGMCELPIPQFPTGVMRGRFHPADGQLYLSGLFAWGGNQTEAGGFYRLRYTGEPVCLPTGLRARQGRMELVFSEDLDPAAVKELERFAVKVWDLRRSAGYGSPHLNERALALDAVTLAEDGRTLTLGLPGLAPTWGMEIVWRVRTRSGREAQGVLHNTIHVLGD